MECEDFDFDFDIDCESDFGLLDVLLWTEAIKATVQSNITTANFILTVVKLKLDVMMINDSLYDNVNEAHKSIVYNLEVEEE